MLIRFFGIVLTGTAPGIKELLPLIVYYDYC